MLGIDLFVGRVKANVCASSRKPWTGDCEAFPSGCVMWTSGLSSWWLDDRDWSDCHAVAIHCALLHCSSVWHGASQLSLSLSLLQAVDPSGEGPASCQMLLSVPVSTDHYHDQRWSLQCQCLADCAQLVMTAASLSVNILTVIIELLRCCIIICVHAIIFIWRVEQSFKKYHCV